MPTAPRSGVRLVLDTNTVVSALLWSGTPGCLTQVAQDGLVELVTSPALLAELQSILIRKKFERVLERRAVTSSQVLRDYAMLCELVAAPPIPPTVLRDPDDDAVLAAALGGHADLIVTGDLDLLDIAAFRSIPIVNAARALAMIDGQEST